MEMKRVLFSDEKKFNGPDRWNYYYRDLLKDRKFSSLFEVK